MYNKTHLRKQSLFDQERHLGLDVPTIETAHAEGGKRINLQNNSKTKPEQLNLSKTDPST
jgi:hypothetical protein